MSEKLKFVLSDKDVFDPYEGPKKPRKAKQMPDKLQFVPKKDDSLKLKS